MVNPSARTIHLVLSAIKNLRELKGSTSREILNYITSIHNIPSGVARRQMQTALKRAVSYGILKKNGAHYALPTNTRTGLTEIATQELGLLDFCARKRKSGKRLRLLRRSGRVKRVACGSRKTRGARLKGRKNRKKRKAKKRRPSSRIGRRVYASLSVPAGKLNVAKVTRGGLRSNLRPRKYVNREPPIEAKRSSSNGRRSYSSRRSRRSLQRKSSASAY